MCYFLYTFIGSLIVSSLENGNVVCMFKLLNSIRSSDCISFNEKSFVLTVIEPHSKKIIRYQVVSENVGALEERNIMYNKTYDSKTWIRQDEEFEKLILVARD